MAIIDNGETSEAVRPALGIARREVLRAENGSGTFLWLAFKELNSLIDAAENDRPGYLHHKVLKADYEEALKLRGQVIDLAKELGVSLNMFGR
jgi:hypothetical protein